MEKKEFLKKMEKEIKQNIEFGIHIEVNLEQQFLEELMK